MTKTQIKKLLNDMFNKGVLGKLEDAVCNALEELEDTIYDLEETRDSIEPYENKDELTEQQNARYEWIDNRVSELQDIKDALEDVQYKMATLQENMEE